MVLLEQLGAVSPCAFHDPRYSPWMEFEVPCNVVDLRAPRGSIVIIGPVTTFRDLK